MLRMGNRSIERTLRRSYDNLGAIRIEDSDRPEWVVVGRLGALVHDAVRGIRSERP